MPLAEAGLLSGRRWNPLDIAVSAAVDTARNGPLTSRHGDSDDSGFRASADGFARYGGRASPPFGATLRGSPAGAGGGPCPL